MLAETAIANLLYTYAERFDAGDFEGAAALFDQATIILAGGRETDGAELLGIWRSRIVLYPCGTPRTKHLVTNPIIAVDEAMFLGGLDKGEFLREFEPDFFFDDQTGHIESAARHVPSGHVISGVRNS